MFSGLQIKITIHNLFYDRWKSLWLHPINQLILQYLGLYGKRFHLPTGGHLNSKPTQTCKIDPNTGTSELIELSQLTEKN